MKISLKNKLFVLFFLGLFSLFSFSFADNNNYAGSDDCNKGDLMQQAFCVSVKNGTQIDMGNTREAVGNAVMKDGIQMDVSLKSGITTKKRSSLIVRTSKSLLMITIVLSVTMVIICGIKWIVKSGNGEDTASVRKDIIGVIVGILLALLSGIIVTLFRSAGNTLGETDTDTMQVESIASSSESDN